MKKSTIVLYPVLNAHWARWAFETFYPLCEYYPTPNAPETWADLKAWHKASGDNASVAMPVYDGACENSIYPTKEDNYLFRAWHDSIHLQYNLSFSLEDETEVAHIHQEQLTAIRAPNCVKKAILADTLGQVEYYYKYGSFVPNQREFVTSVLLREI